MLKAKEILAMSYGTAEQMQAADEYLQRFEKFYSRHPDFSLCNSGFISDTRRKLLMNDVFYQALRRTSN
jgi:hypothetical protein